MPNVPDRTIFDPQLNVYMHTGDNAVEMGQRFKQGHLATDIETPGLDEAFTINCVTMCWTEGEKTHAILLDPRRVTLGLREAVAPVVEVVEAINPSTLLKSRKTEAEAAFIRQAMAEDGAAMCAFYACIRPL